MKTLTQVQKPNALLQSILDTNQQRRDRVKDWLTKPVLKQVGIIVYPPTAEQVTAENAARADKWVAEHDVELTDVELANLKALAQCPRCADRNQGVYESLCEIKLAESDMGPGAGFFSITDKGAAYLRSLKCN